MSTLLEGVEPFPPAGFVSLSLEVPYMEGEMVKSPYKKPTLLPDASILLDEERFADVAMWWNTQGLGLSILVHQSFADVSFPNIEKGDGVELFFDTRDLKEAGSLHKFCHHFIFLPKEVGGIVAAEMTKLRADDSHPLCEPHALHTQTTFSKKSYEIHLFIEKEALYGFDPQVFDRLGFAYIIHRKGGEPQHFNLSSNDYALQKYPSLWASCKLTS